MNHYKQCMVGESTQQVSRCQHEPPGGVPQEVSAYDHTSYQAQNGQKSNRVFTHQAFYLWVFYHNLTCAPPVRLRTRGKAESIS